MVVALTHGTHLEKNAESQIWEVEEKRCPTAGDYAACRCRRRPLRGARCDVGVGVQDDAAVAVVLVAAAAVMVVDVMVARQFHVRADQKILLRSSKSTSESTLFTPTYSYVDFVPENSAREVHVEAPESTSSLEG